MSEPPAPPRRPVRRSLPYGLLFFLAAARAAEYLGLADRRGGPDAARPEIIELSEVSPADERRRAVVDAARREIMRYYHEEVESKKLFHGQIRGMVKALGDPYGSFSGPGGTRRLQLQISGFFPGAGLGVNRGARGALIVMAVAPGSSAEQEGLRRRDVIVTIAGRRAREIPLAEAQQLLDEPGDEGVEVRFRHPAAVEREVEVVVGSTEFWEELLAGGSLKGMLAGGRIKIETLVELVGGDPRRFETHMAAKALAEAARRGSVVTIRSRALGRETFTARLVSRRVRIPIVIGARMMDEEAGIGYVLLGLFSTGVDRDLSAAIERLAPHGLRALVIDLRHNGGGVVKGAEDAARLFLGQGRLVVETQCREESLNSVVRTTADGKWRELPLALLVNGGTYSAAEIFAAALAENDRAVLVGEKTGGSGTVKRWFLLDKEERLSMKISVGRYLTPDGEWIEGRGLRPERLVERSPALVARLRSSIRRDEERRRRQAALHAPNEPGPLPPPLDGDRQIDAAVELLREKLGPPAASPDAPAASATSSPRP